MGKRAKPTTIIFAILGVVGIFVPIGLDKAGIVISQEWAIVILVVSGLLVLLAIAIAFKSYIWSFLRTIKIVRKHQPPSWLEEVLRSDRRELGSRVISHINQWFFEGVYETEPFIKVRIGVINTAVFPVAITGLKGSLEIEGTLCNQPAMLEGGGGLLRLYRGVGFTIRQPINPDTARKIRGIQETGNNVSIGFRECWLALQAKEPSHQTEPVYAGIINVDGNVVSSE